MSNSFSTRVVRVSILLCALIFAYGFWLSRSLAFTDFRVLHLGADLLNQGRMDEAYDSEAFQAASAAHPQLGATSRELDVFLSTPPFGLVMRPFALLSSNTALVLWMVLGIAGVFLALKLLRLPMWAGLVALALPLGVANIYHAQTGFLGLLWVAAVHRLCVDGRTVPAGLVAGLAVVKPTLLLGVAIWWLLEWRRWYPALLSALGVGTAIVAPTVIGGFAWWRSFFGALEQRSEIDIDLVSNQPTLAELVSRLTTVDIGNHPLALIGYLALGVAVMRFVLQCWPGRVAEISGAAVLVSILVSPHLLIYDTPLILVPFAVAVRSGVDLKTLEQFVAIFVVSSLMTIMTFEPFLSINSVVSPGTIGIVLAGVVWFQSLDSIEAVAPSLRGLDGNDGNDGHSDFDFPQAA